jgi:type I site-specific restriction-modification system R (restriction) subunit/very-short-patch-repair endonuclease
VKPITENIIEQSAIEILQSQGWEYANGKEISPEGLFCERENYSQIVLVNRLRNAIAKINPEIPLDAQEAAIQKVLRIASPDLLHNNEEFHKLLVEKVKVPYQKDGYERSHEVALFDFENASNNQFLVVNQYTIIENNQNKRPDVLLFVNGIPLVVIELKNASDENADMRSAYNQIQTYKAIIPSLFTYNSVCIISDGLECKAGSVSADFGRYMTWKTSDGVKEDSRFKPQLETLLKGMLNPSTLLDLVRNFIVFEKTKKEDAKTGLTQIFTEKKLAAYHQYYAVNKAIENTLIAAGVKNSPPLEGWSQTGVVKRGSKNYFELPYNKNLKEKARELRQAENLSEVLFWNQVKNKQFKGFDFDRQKIIGNYIVDFYCTNCNVVIEIDGSSHEDKVDYDAERDAFLESLGLAVIHIPVVDVMKNMNGVMEMLYHHPVLSPPRPSGTPPLEGNFGSRRGGVVWHTQGSGKSLSMVFYSGKLITAPEMQNPTIVVITDRNDLDEQLFDTFAASKQLLRQEPVQAESREHLKELLKVASGGIVFTTIQKFLPEGNKSEYDQLSDRKNIVVIADEAHRTQYGFEAKLVDEKNPDTKEVIGKRIAFGFAKYMRDALPNATYIGFTGTPIEGTDVNTPQVFGQYVDVYDISQAVADGSTVKIYYESRLAKVNLDKEGRRLIEEFDKELEQDEEITEKQKAKAKWTKLEAIVGNKDRIKNLAKDIVTHFEKCQTIFEGKAMIVAMSRRIAADIYREIITLRPQWHDDDLTKGSIKVVMTTNSADGPEISKHHTSKQQRRNLSDRMKDPADPLKLVIVRDMWLTGFDAPVLKTLYIDKPMRGHNLMQAIARVNRVFKEIKGGLVVDYLGIATDLKKALSFYSDAGGKGDPTQQIDEAVKVLMEKLEVVQQMFNEESKTQKDILVEEPQAYYENSLKFNYRRFFTAPPQEKLSIILQAEEHILGLQDGKERFVREVSLLSQALSICISKEEVQPHLTEIAFFQAVKARLVKFEGTGGGRSDIEIETAIKQIVDEALSSDKVVDIFDSAGIDKPDISGLSILSDEFMMEVKGMRHKNLALELLKKILNDEIKNVTKRNLTKGKALLIMLETALKKYQNNLLTTVEIIQFLVDEVAKKVKEEYARTDELKMTVDEVAFYDALAENKSAVDVLGEENLRALALEVADKVRANATIDWTIRESARAKLMVLVRRTLNKYGYPPDKQEKAIETVLQQAELLADNITK